MKKIYFTVGPSQLFPTIRKHIEQALDDDIPSISHRSKQFMDMYKQTTDSLRELMHIPASHHIFFLGSATEAMERILENTVEKHSFHFVNGAFSKKFYTFSTLLGKKPKKEEVPFGEGFDLKAITFPKRTECVCITQNETSCGTIFPMKDIYSIKQKLPQVFNAIDVVSSAPYVTIDFAKVDMAFFSVQKGFGLPSGLGVLIANDEAIKKAELLARKGNSIGSYHTFLTMAEYEKKHQVHETPNVLEVYLLGKICNDYLDKGLEIIRKETNIKAKMIYGFFERHDRFQPAVIDKRIRSDTTIVINTNNQTAEILSQLRGKGFIVSSGYGEHKPDQMRIANFPSQSVDMTNALIDEFRKL